MRRSFLMQQKCAQSTLDAVNQCSHKGREDRNRTRSLGLFSVSERVQAGCSRPVGCGGPLLAPTCPLPALLVVLASPLCFAPNVRRSGADQIPEIPIQITEDRHGAERLHHGPADKDHTRCHRAPQRPSACRARAAASRRPSENRGAESLGCTVRWLSSTALSFGGYEPPRDALVRPETPNATAP